MDSIEIKNQLIYNIKHQMLKQSLTQEDVGKKVGRSRAYISTVLQGKASIDKLITILSQLGVEVTLKLAFTK